MTVRYGTNCPLHENKNSLYFTRFFAAGDLPGGHAIDREGDQ